MGQKANHPQSQPITIQSPPNSATNHLPITFKTQSRLLFPSLAFVLSTKGRGEGSAYKHGRSLDSQDDDDDDDDADDDDDDGDDGDGDNGGDDNDDEDDDDDDDNEDHVDNNDNIDSNDNNGEGDISW